MRKSIRLLVIIPFIILSVACSAKKVNFLTTEDGKKQYKNEDGIFVKDDWVELNGDKYYFDKNGYLVTNDWVQNEYFVDEEGKMKTDYWYNDGKSENYYYLGKDGKYIRDSIVDIGNKKYAFDKDGVWIKNKIFVAPDNKEKTFLADKNGIVATNEGEYELTDNKYYVNENGEIIFNDWKEVDGKKAYYDGEGKRVYNGFAMYDEDIKSTSSDIKRWLFLNEDGDIVKDQYIDYEGENYCAGEDGILLANEWKEYEGKKYYYGPDCNLLKNQIVNGCYYVDDNGAMVINRNISINGKTYSFGPDGKGNIKGNVYNNVSLTKNGNYRIRKYSNSDQKYIDNVNSFQVYETDYIGDSKTSYTNGKAYIIVDKYSIRFRIQYGTSDEKGNSNYVSYIKVSNENNGWDKYRGNIISYSNVEWANGDKYIKLTFDDAKKLVEAIQKNEKLYVCIESYYDFIDASKIYKFMIETDGFIELFNSIL